MQGSIVILVRVHCRRKESSCSLSHLLMSFSCILPGISYHKWFSEFLKWLILKTCTTDGHTAYSKPEGRLWTIAFLLWAMPLHGLLSAIHLFSDRLSVRLI